MLFNVNVSENSGNENLMHFMDTKCLNFEKIKGQSNELLTR